MTTTTQARECDKNNIATWSDQEKAKKLWEREGGHCVSSLVHTLSHGFGSSAGHTDAAQLIGSLCEQAWELAAPIDDWEEAAIQEGWTIGTFGSNKVRKGGNHAMTMEAATATTSAGRAISVKTTTSNPTSATCSSIGSYPTGWPTS